MPRVKRGFTNHRRHKKVLSMVKGHMTSRGHLYKTAHQEMMRSLMYAYRDRRTRKRDMRALWIMRINAAAREHGLPYSRFIAGLNTLGFAIDRKMLAEMAVNDKHGFAVLAARIQGAPDPVRPAAPAAPAPKAAKAAPTPTVVASQAATGEDKDLVAAGVSAAQPAGTSDPLDRVREGDAPSGPG